MAVQGPSESILEAGCGNGRVVRYFQEQGYAITGMDFIPEAVAKLKEAAPDLHVDVGDITRMQYADASFDVVLAFGLYHNLRDEPLERAMAETVRVLKPGGRLCASFRADNWANRINDWHADRKARETLGEAIPAGSKEFHKLNLTKNEFRTLVVRHGLRVTDLLYVENMPFLYKFGFFRHADHRQFDESKGRREGYLLSRLGNRIQTRLMRCFPDQLCNIYVIIAHKD